MKRLFTLFTGLCVMLLAGCNDEYDDSALVKRLDDFEQRLERLERLCNDMNTNLGSMQTIVTALDRGDYITSVEPLTENGNMVGYTIRFAKGTPIVVYNGKPGTAPVVSVKKDTDGIYYWTLDGEFITEGGKKMPVTGDDGVTPVFKIENDTWYVSYDKEATWKECGPATGAAGDSFFSDVSTSEDGRWVYLTLADGETVLTLEMYKEFGIAFESLPELIMAGATAEIPFVLTGADDNSVVEAIAKGDWEAEVVMDGTEGGKIVVTAPAESSTGRVIVLLSDGESKTIMKTLTFVSGVMNVTTQSQEAAAVGGTVSFELETDLDYEVVIPDDAKEWLSCVETRALRQETLTFSAKANETMEERQAKIELISSGVVVETLLVYQKANLDPTAFVVKVNVTESSMKNTLILPLTGTVDATVDWGDGKTETVTAVNPQHVYEQEGEYYVTVIGSVTALGNRLTKTSQSAIVRVIQWGQLGLESLEEAFYNNKGLTQVALPDAGAFAKVTTVENMFYNCTLLTAVPVGLIDQCTELTSAASLFSGCSSLTSIPEGFFDNCPKIASLASAFKGCKKVTEIPAGLFDNLTEVTDVSGLFTNCTALVSVPDGLLDKLTKVTTVSSFFNGCSSLRTVPNDFFKSQTEVTASGMIFKGCSSLESVPSGLLDPFTKTTTIGSLFSGCKSLGNLPEGLFDKVGSNVDPSAKAVDASYLFENCVKMTDFPSLSKLPNVSNVASLWRGCTAMTTVPADYFPSSCTNSISVGNMFNGCTSLKSLPAGLLKNMTDITTALSMFTNCSSLETLPEGFFDAMVGCTNIKEMFKGCTSLESLPAGLFDKMTSITATASAFYGCTGFTGESPYLNAEIDGKPVKVHLYDRPDYPELFVKVPAKATDYKDTFKNCKQMADYAMIPIAWGGVSDGTKAKPIIALSYALPENMEYHGINFTVKGTEFKSGKYIVGTTELVQSVLDEFDGNMEKATNKYGIGFTATQLETLMSDAGLQLPFNDLEPETEYMLLVRGQNVHGLTFETLTATTAVRPQGSADYERYIGTWTVTTTSSEVTGQPQTYTIRIEPYRNDKSYKVYDWGVTTLGSKEEDFPFILSYNEADGSVGINSYEDLGMYGFTYYIYLRYRFLNEQSQPSIWVSEDTLVSGAYDAASNEITITCGTFNDNSGITQKITGLDYVLYTGGKYYEAQNLIRPGYLIGEGDNAKVDYGVGPYKLTKAPAAAAVPAKRPAKKFESLRPASETKQAAAVPLGVGRLSMMSVH